MTKLVDIPALEVKLKTEKYSTIKSIYTFIFENDGGIENRRRIRELMGFRN